MGNLVENRIGCQFINELEKQTTLILKYNKSRCNLLMKGIVLNWFVKCQ